MFSKLKFRDRENRCPEPLLFDIEVNSSVMFVASAFDQMIEMVKGTLTAVCTDTVQSREKIVPWKRGGLEEGVMSTSGGGTGDEEEGFVKENIEECLCFRHPVCADSPVTLRAIEALLLTFTRALAATILAVQVYTPAYVVSRGERGESVNLLVVTLPIVLRVMAFPGTPGPDQSTMMCVSLTPSTVSIVQTRARSPPAVELPSVPTLTTG